MNSLETVRAQLKQHRAQLQRLVEGLVSHERTIESAHELVRALETEEAHLQDEAWAKYPALHTEPVDLTGGLTVAPDPGYGLEIRYGPDYRDGREDSVYVSSDEIQPLINYLAGHLVRNAEFHIHK
jgi:hypothetical protein